MRIVVRRSLGWSIGLDVEPTDTVDSVKLEIQRRKRGVPVRRLKYNEVVLDEGTLSDYNVQERSQLFVKFHPWRACPHCRSLGSPLECDFPDLPPPSSDALVVEPVAAFIAAIPAPSIRKRVAKELQAVLFPSNPWLRLDLSGCPQAAEGGAIALPFLLRGPVREYANCWFRVTATLPRMYPFSAPEISAGVEHPLRLHSALSCCVRTWVGLIDDWSPAGSFVSVLWNLRALLALWRNALHPVSVGGDSESLLLPQPPAPQEPRSLEDWRARIRRSIRLDGVPSPERAARIVALAFVLPYSRSATFPTAARPSLPLLPFRARVCIVDLLAGEVTAGAAEVLRAAGIAGQEVQGTTAPSVARVSSQEGAGAGPSAQRSLHRACSSWAEVVVSFRRACCACVDRVDPAELRHWLGWLGQQRTGSARADPDRVGVPGMIEPAAGAETADRPIVTQ